MKSDNVYHSWDKFKRINNSDEIPENEILGIIECVDYRVSYFTERVIRNTAIFSFLLAFCQNCYV